MPQADGTGQLLPAAGHPLSVKCHFQAVTFCRLTTNTQHETFGCWPVGQPSAVDGWPFILTLTWCGCICPFNAVCSLIFSCVTFSHGTLIEPSLGAHCFYTVVNRRHYCSGWIIMHTSSALYKLTREP